ncbi:hypothetical protein I553_8246 [Mycobacterium xenopi 4042]|uniref:Uncharacterized protein n=1 Tax=Mycobacterium xenopi 4042 TaxID=1299334 RepID=X8BII2_MYCXE|nr:hypothetical protein I553_8246 [Mycobacterium xenopi 4042]
MVASAPQRREPRTTTRRQLLGINLHHTTAAPWVHGPPWTNACAARGSGDVAGAAR